MQSIDTLLVIGVGLIGGSLSLALKKQGKVKRVIGYGRNPTNLSHALERGIIDESSHDLTKVAADANLVLLACPVGAMAEVMAALVHCVRDDVVITDAGSTKQTVIQTARKILGNKCSRFVPGHPIAGSEKSGAGAAFAELYDKHRVLLTPDSETDPGALALVSQMWRSVGATVSTMNAEDHDKILGLTSHLPHVLAYALVDYLSSLPDAETCFELAAGGFYDFTRIASSDPVMWRDITLENRNMVLAAIDGYQTRLQHLRSLVENCDSGAIENLYRNARDSRNQLLDRRKAHIK